MADLQAQFESECRARHIPFEIEETRDSLVIWIDLDGTRLVNSTGLTGEAECDAFKREFFFSSAVCEIRQRKAA